MSKGKRYNTLSKDKVNNKQNFQIDYHICMCCRITIRLNVNGTVDDELEYEGEQSEGQVGKVLKYL